MPTNQIDRIDHLILLTKESLRHYQALAQSEPSDIVGQMMQGFIQQRQTFLGQLHTIRQQLTMSEPSSPPESDNASPPDFTTFLQNLYAVQPFEDQDAVLQTCLQNDADALQAYSDLLSSDVSSEVKYMLQHHYAIVRAIHTHLRSCSPDDDQNSSS